MPFGVAEGGYSGTEGRSWESMSTHLAQAPPFTDEDTEATEQIGARNRVHH